MTNKNKLPASTNKDEKESKAISSKRDTARKKKDHDSPKSSNYDIVTFNFLKVKINESLVVFETVYVWFFFFFFSFCLLHPTEKEVLSKEMLEVDKIMEEYQNGLKNIEYIMKNLDSARRNAVNIFLFSFSFTFLFFFFFF